MAQLAETLRTAIMRRKQVQALTGLARSTLYKLVASGDFPPPIRLTAKAVGWSSVDVDGWIAARIASSKPS